jgi:purine-binding chemotaxis protein CheW
MADARKRARRPGGKAGSRKKKAPAPPDAPTEKTTVPAAEPEETSGGVTLPPSGLAADVLGDEPAATESSGRIELPSSGLAADVLAQPETAAVPATPSAPETPDEPEADSSAVHESGQSLSFFAAPAREEREAAEAVEHLATFVLDREEYGVDVKQVQEIRRVGEITAVPRAPEFVRGVINLRGRILPVLDLKRKLGLGDVALERTARIVVVRTGDRMLGLLVDGASQVLKVPVSRVEPPPDEVVERGGDYIRAVAKLDDRLIILIDLGRVLAQELREAPTAGA